MILIDKTYFVGPLHLPKDDYTGIEQFFAGFQEEVLKSLMGEWLYKIYLASEEDEPYKTLRDGGVYTVDTNDGPATLAYPGLRDLVGHYTYCEIMRNRVTSTQSVGETKSHTENSSRANSFRKIYSAYAKFEELYGYEGQDELIPSAYNYLKANKDTLFPQWRFEDLRGGINGHDL